MVTLLTNIFIKNKDDVESPSVRKAYGTLCGLVGILLNLFLFAGKFIAGLISNSIAITADAINNLSDAGSSLITLIGFQMAGQKPDPEHPFGHGRIEYLSGLLVSLAIILMGFELVKSSFTKIIHPEETTFSLLIIFILLASILVKIYMAFYNHKISIRIQSAAMNATATDSLSDTLSTTVVLICTLISHFTGLKIDGYCGVAVGLFILYAGFGAAKDTISPLLGQPPQKEFIADIEKIVRSFDGVLGIHDLVVHDYGPGRIMVSLHAEVSADGNIMEIHDMIDNIEHILSNELHCEAVIHMDPIQTGNTLSNTLKDKVAQILHSLDPALQFHDFRIVAGPTHTNILFDVPLPFKYKMTDKEVTTYLSEEISRIDPTYFAVIHIDKIYS